MNNIEIQLEKVKRECFELSKLLPYEKLRVEYNKNKKIKDNGKIEVLPIITSFCS